MTFEQSGRIQSSPFYLNKRICKMVRTNSLTIFIYASNEPKSVLARDLGVAKRQWRLFSNDRNGV